MADQRPDHALEFLLAFDGLVHYLAGGYSLRFDIGRVEATSRRPHGLSYSLTLHAPDGTRLVGFDNAHPVRDRRGRFSRRLPESDHWHRTERDPGRLYTFVDAETLIDDFFDEVGRVLAERGIDLTVTSVGTRRTE
jgi:hypothetical protein